MGFTTTGAWRAIGTQERPDRAIAPASLFQVCGTRECPVWNQRMNNSDSVILSAVVKLKKKKLFLLLSVLCVRSDKEINLFDDLKITDGSRKQTKT